jgi:hypothetical protein
VSGEFGELKNAFDINHLVVERAVNSEPVSPCKIPCNRVFYRENLKNRLLISK